jgi:hypothetical protein
MRDLPDVPAKSNDANSPVPKLAPADYCDPVIEFYKKDVDRTLLRENLKLPVEERIRKAEAFHRALDQLREAGRKAREERAP